MNAGLEDVYTFYESVKKSDNIDRSLEQYEKLRLPQIKALCQLMVFGYPTQYKGISTFRDTLWKLNFLTRFVLHKAVPAFFALPSFILIQDERIPYSDILRIVHGTTRNITLLFSSIAALLGYKWIRLVLNKFLCI